MATLCKRLPRVLPDTVRTTTTYPDGTSTVCTLRLTHPQQIAEPRYTLTAETDDRRVEVGPMPVEQALEAERLITLGPSE